MLFPIRLCLLFHGFSGLLIGTILQEWRGDEDPNAIEFEREESAPEDNDAPPRPSGPPWTRAPRLICPTTTMHGPRITSRQLGICPLHDKGYRLFGTRALAADRPLPRLRDCRDAGKYMDVISMVFPSVTQKEWGKFMQWPIIVHHWLWDQLVDRCITSTANDPIALLITLARSAEKAAIAAYHQGINWPHGTTQRWAPFPDDPDVFSQGVPTELREVSVH